MSESRYYDALETRDVEVRERELFSALPASLRTIKEKSGGWAELLADVDEQTVTSREALAKLPVLRKSELGERQKAKPPFGDLTTTPVGQLGRLFMSPGPIFDPEGRGDDWWRVARALYAAGIRPGDIIHNSFAYHLTPAGHMFESGGRALGCPIIPAGIGNTEMQIQAIEALRPAGYAGTPDYLKVLLDAAEAAGCDSSSLKKGLVSGAALPPSLRSELSERGIDVVQCYGTADLGIVAYESQAKEGMIIDENIIVEIVTPGTGDSVASGEVGEIVVTNLNPDYPMIRFATGDMSAIMPGVSPCGRTNQRIKGWMGRADQAAKVKGMFVRPEQIAEIARRHPELGRLRLVVERQGEQDMMTLRAEAANTGDAASERIAETVQSVCKLRGAVELVTPGSLPKDGVVIADERNYD